MTTTLRKRLVFPIFLAAATVFPGTLSRAADDPPARRPHGPPPAAFEACAQKAAGEACSVAMPDRTITGVCAEASDARLFCRPDHPPGPPPGDGDGDQPRP